MHSCQAGSDRWFEDLPTSLTSQMHPRWLELFPCLYATLKAGSRNGITGSAALGITVDFLFPDDEVLPNSSILLFASVG